MGAWAARRRHNRPEPEAGTISREAVIYATFFRSFYLFFAGLFSLRFFASSAIVLSAARLGDPPSATVGVGVATLCAMLIGRALRYMGE